MLFFNTIFFAWSYQVILNRSILPIDGAVKATISLDRNGPGSNSNKELLHTPQIFRWGTSLLDPVYFYIYKKTLLRDYFSAGDTINNSKHS